MPISLSAKASLRKSVKNQSENKKLKGNYKKVLKGFLAKPSGEGLNKMFSEIDKLVKKNIFHRNKGARLKSRFSKLMPKP